MRPAAGNAALRPDQKRSRSASSRDTVIRVAPAAVRERRASARSRPRLPPACRRDRTAGSPRRRGRSRRPRTARPRVAGRSIISRPAGMMPAAMTSATAWPALSTSSNDAITTCAHCGLGSSFTVTSVTTTSMPLRADDEREQVVARRIEGRASRSPPARPSIVAAHAQHVVHGEAVLQAMHAAGILGDVAADGAGDLARRIGRVVQAEWRRRLRDRGIAHAGLHDCDACERVHAQHAHELGHRQQHAVARRQRSARKPGARAARHHRHVHRSAGLEDAPTCSSVSGSATTIGSCR